MNTNSKYIYRIEYIDIARAIAMVLVVLGHINFANSDIKAWVYSFHMPAFFFISGMVAKWRAEYNRRSFCSDTYKSFPGLIIPYIVWSLIYCEFSPSNLALIAYGSYNALSAAGTMTSLWFLPVMFVALLFFRMCNLLIKDTNKDSHYTLLMIALSIAAFTVGFLFPKTDLGYPFSANVAFVAFGFLLVGNLVSPVICKVNLYLSAISHKKGGAIITISMLLFAVIGSFFITLLYRFNIPEYGYILMGNGIYGNPIIFVLVAFFGTVMIISLAWCSIRIKILKRLLTFVGMNTLAILFVQKPIIAVFRKLCSRVHLPTVISLCVTCVGTITICCFAAHLLNKMVPNLVGRNNTVDTTP